LSEEIIKQENKAKPEFKIIQNETIVFKHNLDPNTGEVLKE
jgi:hypothetical protein